MRECRYRSSIKNCVSYDHRVPLKEGEWKRGLFHVFTEDGMAIVEPPKGAVLILDLGKFDLELGRYAVTLIQDEVEEWKGAVA